MKLDQFSLLFAASLIVGSAYAAEAATVADEEADRELLFLFKKKSDIVIFKANTERKFMCLFMLI